MNTSISYAHHLSVAAAENVTVWLNEPKYAQYKSELEAMIADEKWQELEDSFFAKITFGTGGIRGMTGLGSNRINRVTMGEAAQALCQYALQQDPLAPQKGVAIACDVRLTSPEFNRYVAQVCAANGFKTYIYESFRSTPQLSFTVRDLECAIGIVVSASHNPPTDNGFKAYWSDGGQLVAPHDKALVQLAAEIKEIKTTDYDEALAQGHIVVLDASADDTYVEAVVNESLGADRALDIVYSPLHGAGQTNVLPVLKVAGFAHVSTVEAQMVPDGNFPTVPGGKSNPEEPHANDMAIAQLLSEKADIAITNDPDADRIGIMARQGDGAVAFTGNQSLALATDYVLGQLQAKGKLRPTDYAVKTIVTTDMINALTAHYGAKTYDSLPVGIKFIAELMTKKEKTDERFLIGGEESYGLTLGDYIREKDGAAGALVIAELAATLKAQGKTLVDRLFELFVQHGVFAERLDSVYCQGAEGFEVMQAAMARLRSQPPTEVAGHTVTALRDYSVQEERNIVSGETTSLECQKTNVVTLIFNNDSRCRVTVRPSGTEPKMKFYVQWYEAARNAASVKTQYDEMHTILKELSKALERIVLSD
jgi:phosphoglucomutase/phosphomannomutase